ncbi:MAG: hypothetical protein P8N76_08715 [Pirellulaceae bacterium]|nr:hypothetical protein [Pirellulaceae bacterium]
MRPGTGGGRGLTVKSFVGSKIEPIICRKIIKADRDRGFFRTISPACWVHFFRWGPQKLEPLQNWLHAEYGAGQANWGGDFLSFFHCPDSGNHSAVDEILKEIAVDTRLFLAPGCLF